MNFKTFFISFLFIIVVVNAQLYYNAPTVAEYAWPAVGESAPYYAAGYAGIPVASYPSYPYTYAIGSGLKRSPQSVPQMPSAFLKANKA
uniref:Uncharacterized protein n=1 Tax=Panagrolaimus superbus TaxID=310955 RepID=A0A914Z553_9BILA